MSSNGWEDCCLGCGCKTSIGARRKLGSDASRSILPLWEKVLKLELQRCWKEVDKMTLIGDGHSKTSGCICRACFRNFEKYGKLEATLAENMRKAIVTLPTCSTATSPIGRKRGSKDDEHGSGDKRPRVESAGADVGISSKAKKLHPKVATSTSVSPAVAVSCVMLSACYSVFIICVCCHLIVT